MTTSPSTKTSQLVCQLPECGKRVYRKKLCGKHYRAQLDNPPCTEQACNGVSVTKGLCQYHYQSEHRKTYGVCKVQNCNRPAVSLETLCPTHYSAHLVGKPLMPIRHMSYTKVKGIRPITFRNETHSIREWARLTGISANVISLRLSRGSSVVDALTGPMRSKRIIPVLTEGEVTKICTRCHIEQPLSEYKSKYRGYNAICDHCASLKRPVVKRSTSKLRQQLGEHEFIILRKRYSLAYRSTKHGKASSKVAKALHSAAGNIDTDDIHYLEEVQENRCAYCGVRLTGRVKAHLDHILAVANNGLSDLNNLVLACSDCNNDKRANDWLTWFREQVFHSQEREDWITNHIANAPKHTDRTEFKWME